MANKTNSGLCECAKSMVGQGYWTGCYGQKATQDLYDYKHNQYPTATFPSNYKEQIANGTRVMDCSGLVKGYYWGLSLDTDPVYDANTDWNQQGMYNHATVKGPISTFPYKTGALVFLGSSATSLTHVGVYCAEDDKVYHASTPTNGVKVSTFKEFGASYWAQYSEIKDDTGVTDGFDASANTDSGTTSTPTSSGSYTDTLDVDGYWGEKTVKRLQTVLGTTVDGVVSDQYTSEKTRNPGLAQVAGVWEFMDNPTSCSSMIKALQMFLNTYNNAGLTVDGHIDKDTIKAMQKFFGTTQDGVISAPSDVVKAMQTWMNNQLDIDGYWGKATITRLQGVMGTTADGKISQQDITEKTRNPGLAAVADYWEFVSNPKGGSDVLKKVQTFVNKETSAGLNVDGFIGIKTISAMQYYFGTTQDGVISKPSDMVKAMQEWLNNQP